MDITAGYDFLIGLCDKKRFIKYVSDFGRLTQPLGCEQRELRVASSGDFFVYSWNFVEGLCEFGDTLRPEVVF
jgi:hypothetical protein